MLKQRRERTVPATSTPAVRPSHRVVAATSEGEFVLLHTQSGRLFSANPVGARIWSSLDRHAGTAAIARAMSCEFGITEASAIDDVNRFVAELARHQLVNSGRTS